MARDVVLDSRPPVHILAVAALLPIVGAIASSLSIRNLVLAVFLLLGSFVFIVFSRMNMRIRDRLYPILLVCIILSLLLSATAISDNLHGWDIQGEFSIFTRVFESGTWNANTAVLYNSALSISILPSVLSVVSGLGGITIFMFMMPMLFSIVPAVLYKIYRTILAPDGAFLAVFLFMSYPSSYQEMTELGRQEIAELLLVLALWLIVSLFLRIKTQGRRFAVPFVLLTAGIVVSHYSMAYLFILLLVVSILLSNTSGRVRPLATVGMCLLAAVFALFWYMVVAGGTSLFTLGRFLSFVVNGLGRDFLNPSARPEVVLLAIGAKAAMPGPLHDLNRVIQYTVIFLLVFGFGFFVCRGQRKTEEKTIFTLIVTGFLLLGSAVTLPFFARGFNLSRFYHISLLLVSPCFMYGLSGLEQSFRKLCSLLHPRLVHRSYSLRWIRMSATVILYLYFLFTSGWFWAASLDRPTSIVLDRQRMLTYPDPILRVEYNDGYTPAQDVSAARFVKMHVPIGASLCADIISRKQVLVSTGELPADGPGLPSECGFSTSYVYLSTVNSRYGIGLSGHGTPWYLSDIAADLSTKNVVCSNGGASIYG